MTESNIMETDAKGKLNFTFAGCGFMGIYHIGVASCIRKYAPQYITENLIGGASAGAMVACILLCEAPLGHCTSWTLSLANEARKRSLGPMHPTFNITDHLRKGLNEILPQDAHTRCNGRLHISMTRVKDMSNMVVNEFKSREELIQALLCSAFIPFWSGMVPPLFRGERCVDGALSNNLPRINSHTVTVSPFCGRSDICPQDKSLNILYMHVSNTSVQFSMRNMYRISRIMFPPHAEKLGKICKQGFEDALAYLKKLGLVSCSRHLAVRSVLSRRTESVCFDMNEMAEEEEEMEQQTNCAHCAQVKKHETHLHPQVITALEEAVDVVNSSYVLYMKNCKPYRTLSVMVSPLYLPFDIAIHTLRRVLRYLPSVHTDVKWLVDVALWYTKLLSGKVITTGKSTYTANFVCQFAITEVQHSDFTADMVHSQTYSTKTHVHDHRVRDQRIGFGVGVTSKRDSLQLVHMLREEYLEAHKPDHIHVTDHNPQTGADIQASIPTSGYTSRVVSRAPSRAPSRPVSRPASRPASRPVSRRPSISEGIPSLGSNMVLNDEDCLQYIDTFDECIHVADQKDALLAYYYKDEEGQLKATEIFALDDDETNTEMATEFESGAQVDDPISMTCAEKLKRYGSTRSVIASESMDDISTI